jgi:hypothetical protein
MRVEIEKSRSLTGIYQLKEDAAFLLRADARRSSDAIANPVGDLSNLENLTPVPVSLALFEFGLP